MVAEPLLEGEIHAVELRGTIVATGDDRIEERRDRQSPCKVIEIGVVDATGPTFVHPHTGIQIEVHELIAVPAVNIVDGGGHLLEQLSFVANRGLMNVRHGPIGVVEEDGAGVSPQCPGRK